MTERIHSLPPHIATPTQSVFNAAARTSSTKDALPFQEPYEEEPYTIKCICDYSDDDGNTIYCETCDTWQHIECFYHGNVEEASRDDFNHFCADCKPRLLDRRDATERQRQQREDRPIQDTGDKKNKRPPSKSHKKKPKPSELQVNGYYHDHDAGHSTKAGSPLEGHSKKSKSGHRSHHSISSQAAKRSPPHNHRNHSHGHPISPATTPPDLPDDFRIHSYSKQLQDIYDNDPGAQHLQANSFASLAVTDTMSLWLRDPEKLRADAGVEDSRDVFQMVKPDVDLAAHPWAKLQVKSKEIPTNDSILRLRYLSVVEPLRITNALVGELKGVVGFQKDYYNEETDRYTKTCHPAPFVFFHPRLPLYIDTRREGSQCRYIRRSCRANTTLDTYITNHSEYHFCILNERPLASGEQVTLPWDFRFKTEIKARSLYLLGLSDEDVTGDPEVTELEYAELTELIDNVLSDYGGCACGLETDCAFARFHRNYIGRLPAMSNGVRNKKGRKPKQHVSPTSTGHATNSRDASEGHQEPYDGEDDSRSTSGSIQGKPRSRDMTPFGHGFDGANRNPSEHVSEREKRKLMDIEKTFEKMAQEQQPPRKKKRTSDGPIPNSGNGASIPQKTKQKSIRSSISNPSSMQTNGSMTRTYKDAATSRQESYSPTNAQSPAAATSVLSRPPSRQHQIPVRSNYRDCSTQTDELEDAWYSKPQTPTPKKTYVSLSKRLLSSQHKLRLKKEARPAEQRAYMMNGVETQSMSHASNPELHDSSLKRFGPGYANSAEIAERPKSGGSSAPSTEGTMASIDIPMTDVPPSIVATTSKPPPPPWPGTFNPATYLTSPLENRSSDLRVQMPPNPLLSNGIHAMPATPTGSTMPSSVAGSVSQSPFSSVFPSTFPPSMLNSIGPHPSPVKEKKKLSIQDYRALRASVSKASITKDSDSTPVALKTSLSGDDSKMTGILEGSAIVNSPVAEKKEDPLSAAGNEL
jgi:uncharacterized protein